MGRALPRGGHMQSDDLAAPERDAMLPPAEYRAVQESAEAPRRLPPLRAERMQQLLSRIPAGTVAVSHPDLLEEKFQRLAEAWRKETQFESSVTALTTNWNYLKIAAMGWVVVPILLRELADRPDHWFVALWLITEAEPVEPRDAGNLQAMARAWLKWGREHGQI